MFVNEAAYLAALVAPFGPAAGPDGVSFAEARTLDDLDQAADKLAGTFAVAMPEGVWPRMTVSVPVSRLADFKPANVAKNCPELAAVLRAAAFVDEAPGKGLTLADMARALGEDFGPLPLDFSLPAGSGPEASPAAPSAAKDAGPSAGAIDAILDMVAAPGAAPAPSSLSGLAASWKRGLLALAGEILAAVFADPDFRAAETAWRGARFILQNADRDSPFGLSLVCAERDGLVDALTAVVRRFGETPPGMLLVDAFLDAAPARMAVWEVLAETAQTLVAPCGAALSPSFFHLKDWSEASRIGYPSTAIADPSFAKWRKLAAAPEGAMLAALFNRMALRPAYGPENPARPVPFSESEPLWASPVYALGAAVARSFRVNGWPHLFGVGGGVILDDLAVTVRGGRAACVEVLLSDDQLLDFGKAGFMPLGSKSGGDAAFFRRPVAVDGSTFAMGLFLSRVLGFFFASRADERLQDAAEKGNLDKLAGLLEMRFNLFFEHTGHAAPGELSIEAEAAAPGQGAGEGGERPGVRLAIRFRPTPSLGLGTQSIAFSFLW